MSRAEHIPNICHELEVAKNEGVFLRGGRVRIV